MTTKALEAASKALVKKYHEYWPGSWPAKPEADGLSKDDLAPVREAIAKAEHGRVSVGLNDELLVAAWLCTKRDNGHSILRFTQPKDHKQWTFRPLFLGGRDDHG